MKFSSFGKKFTKNSGILQLMDDLGKALASDKPINMLGGGNPAVIRSVNTVFQDTLIKIANDRHALESMANYSTPQGDAKFIATLVDFFNRHYGWGLTADNIVLTNGSQNGFFYLFNLFAGHFDDGEKAICCLWRLSMLAMRKPILMTHIFYPHRPSSKRSITMVKKDFLNIEWILTNLKIYQNLQMAKSEQSVALAPPTLQAMC
ncbi:MULTISPECIES: hypothetical protein [unclassified Moraxella]|uniref:hypothetical protein n=1 Tax=unclassified Moraxella TaxID=2685852 RepID=UPI00359D7597